ncbi:MAG: hypothetical protein ACPLQS_06160 [Desulfurococcaceae archaeon]
MEGKSLSYLIIVLLLIDVFIPIINVKASTTPWVIQESSLTSYVGGRVYPGSRNAKLTVVTRYLGNTSILNPVACIDLPSGFSVMGSRCVPGRDADNNALSIVEPGNSTYYIFTLNVDRSVSPGNYVAGLNITYYLLGSSVLEWDMVYIPLTISPYPSLNIVIKDSYFTPYNYPGACPVNVVIGIINNGESSIEALRLTLDLPSDVTDPSELKADYVSSISPGNELYLNLGSTCISPSVNPNTRYTGTLRVEAQLLTDDGVSYTDEEYYYVEFSVGGLPGAKLRVISYELTSGVSLPGFKNTGLRVLIKSEEQGVLTLTHAKVTLWNAVNINGSTTAFYAHNIVLNYLESTWITYNELSVFENASYVKANITLYGSVTRQGVEYPVVFEISLLIPLSERELDINIERIEWSRAHVYPGSTGNTLVITLLNNESSLSIMDATVKVTVQKDVIYPGELVARNIALNPGSLVEVSYTDIIVPEATKPGVYNITINITGIARGQDGSYRFISLLRNASLIIADLSVLEPVLPILEVVDSYWGEGSPQYIYPGNSRAAYTVVLRNNGTVTALNILVLVDEVDPGDLSFLNNASTCAVQLAPGSTCTAVFYLDLTRASSGVKKFNLKVQYGVQGVGVNTIFTQYLATSIYLPEYQAGSNVTIANYGWLNNNPVFPRTKSAVLTVNLVNLEAYNVYSVWVSLTTPSCMSIREGTPRTVYIAGPVTALQTFTASFTLDLHGCTPGTHQAIIDLDYYVQTAGGGVRKKVSQLISLLVENDENSIEYITSGWINTPVTPPVYGAQYYIVLRNAKFPSISNPILKLELPRGVTESKTNSSRPALTPAMSISAQQAYLIQSIPSNLAQLISQYMQQTPSSVTGVNKGDVVVFIVSLNIELENVSAIDVPYTLTFIDNWGEEYDYSSMLKINLLTAPPVLEVRPVSPLVVFRNGTATIDILVENKYSSPVNNLYIALIPVSSNVIPQNAVKYIGKLEGESNVTVKFEAVYNPVQISVGTVPVSMSSAVFTATLIFVDVSGALHTLNTTLAVMIKPFIELKLMPSVTAKYSKGTLIVNGIIANTGISTARSVIAYIKYGNVESVNIIGDIDPASQTPFRLEIQAPYTSDNCTLAIKYRDEYGSEYVFETQLTVTQTIEQVQTTTTVTSPMDTTFKVIIIVLVAVFLAGLFFVLYRHSRQVMKRVTHEVE